MASVRSSIWTEADSLHIDYQRSLDLQRPIAELMSPALFTVDCSLTLDEAALEFKSRGIRHLVVVDDKGDLFGILSQSDVVTRQDAEYFLSLTEVDSVLSGGMPPWLDADCLLAEAVAQMRGASSDSLVVTINGVPEGLITERDLVRLIAQGQMQARLEDVMSRPLISVPRTMSLLAARSLMERRGIRHLGVEDEFGVLQGLISFADILANY